MPAREDIHNSILIVSGSEQFAAIVKKALHGYAFATVDIRKSAAASRQCIMERYYNIIVIDSPLPDESGLELALDTVEQCSASLLMVVPAEIYEDILDRVTDYGVLVIHKPGPRGRIGKAVRFLAATHKKIRRLEKKILTMEEKMEEIRIVSKAKVLLVEKRQMTEDEAHRYIGKMAMDQGVSRKRIAEKILDEL